MKNSSNSADYNDQGEQTAASSERLETKELLGKHKDPLLHNEHFCSVLEGLIKEFNGVKVGKEHLYFQIRTFAEYGEGNGPSVDGFIGGQFWGREVDYSGDNVTKVLSISGANYPIPYFFRTVEQAINWLEGDENRIDSWIARYLPTLRKEKSQVLQFSQDKFKDDRQTFTPYQSGYIEQLFLEEGYMGALITHLEHKHALQNIRGRLTQISALNK